MRFCEYCGGEIASYGCNCHNQYATYDTNPNHTCYCRKCRKQFKAKNPFAALCYECLNAQIKDLIL